MAGKSRFDEMIFGKEKLVFVIDVKLNDEIEVIFGRRHLKVKVLAIKEVVRKNDADILYEVIDEWMDEE